MSIITRVKPVYNIFELECEHKRNAIMISYGLCNLCCYVCWLEDALEEAENKLEELQEEYVNSLSG